jgi:hypothetical protein
MNKILLPFKEPSGFDACRVNHIIQDELPAIGFEIVHNNNGISSCLKVIAPCSSTSVSNRQSINRFSVSWP